MSLRVEFERLTAEIIGGFPAAAQEEHLQLDFKLVNDPNLGGQGDRKILAKCISGFANSSGGIVVWGVDARRNDEGIDCAGEIQPINSLGIFLSRLNELSGRATSPAVEGVVHKKFETSSNRGFAATLGRVDKQDFQISGSLIQGSFAGGYNDPGFDERQRMGLS